MTESKIKELLKIALTAASNSPDPSTQNGAIIVDDDGNIVLGEDCNRLPNNIVMEEKHTVRPQKYYYFEHAERNVIFLCAKNGIRTNGKIMVCPWFACADCARAIVQAGIKEVIGFPRPLDQTNDRWKETCDVADQILDDAGVIRTYVQYTPGEFGIKLRRDGKELDF